MSNIQPNNLGPEGVSSLSTVGLDIPAPQQNEEDIVNLTMDCYTSNQTHKRPRTEGFTSTDISTGILSAPQSEDGSGVTQSDASRIRSGSTRKIVATGSPTIATENVDYIEMMRSASRNNNLPFDGIQAHDLMQIVKAYVTRTFAEELKLIEDLTQKATAKDFCDLLRTSMENGISDNKTLRDQREDIFGTNTSTVRKPTPFWYLLWTASKDFILRVLMIAGILSLALALAFGEKKEIEWIEGAAIFLAVIIVLLVTAGNDWFKERQFAALVQKDEKFRSVRRDGVLHSLSTEKLLVGDVILVEAGDEVPSDCITLSCRDLALDESSMTGESDPVKKTSIESSIQQRDALQSEKLTHTATDTHHAVRSPVVLSGSTVTTGSGILLVVAVGENSQAGQLLQKLSIDTDPTPLQNKLNALARDIGNLGFAAACITLFVLILQYWILYAVQFDDRPDKDFGDIMASHVQFLVEAITIIVVAVPEGLPLAVTLSLAFSVGRMLKDQNYVRRLAACETMGGANEICSDKTGTLTKNRMAVQAFWNGSKLSEVDGRTTLPNVTENELVEGEAGSTAFGFPRLPKQYFDILLEAMALNSTAYLEEEEVGAKATGAHRVTITKHIGSPTECALLQFMIDMGFDYTKIRSEKGTEDNIVHRITFDSERKLMTTVVKCPDPSTPHLYRVYVKGAAEIVLRLCRTRIDSAGALRTVESIHIDRIERQVIDPMTCQALRTICIAYKDFDPNILTDWKEIAPQTDVLFPASPPFSPGRRSSGPRLLAPYRSLEQSRQLASSNMFKLKKIYKMEMELNCLGIAGMSDPVREEVPAAVRRCQEAGIRVRMVTGDNIETAKQIGIKCNIYHPETGGLAMTGQQFISSIGGIVCEACRTEQCNCPTFASMAGRAKTQRRSRATAPPRGASSQSRGLGSATVLTSPGRFSRITTTSTTHGPVVSSLISANAEQMVAVEVSPPSEPHELDKTFTLNKTDQVHIVTTSTGDSATSRTPTPSPNRRCCRACCCSKKVQETTATLFIADETETLLSKKVRVDVLGNLDVFKKIAEKLEVLARSQPNDKYALVLGLKQLGAVVAVTGDGTNDAPALKKADVGFAMGIAGKEVAKQAADIVLLDDNFESIVKAVKWGRNIYDNIRRFLQFQLTVNIVAVITAFVGAAVLRSSPLNAVQLLWVNLIMDTFASLALATEPPTEQLLDRKPHSRTEYLVNRLMTRNILGQTAYQLVVMMMLIFSGDRWLPEWSSKHYLQYEGLYGGFSQFSPYNDGHSYVASGRRFKPFSNIEEYKHKWTVNIGPSRHYTIVFNTFVWLQIFNMINARKISNEWNVFSRALSNPLWLFIMTIICVGQVLLTQFGGYALECHLDGLTIGQWGICLALGAGTLVVQLALHFVPAQRIKYIPQAGSKEADLMAGSTSLALASRGRISTERLSSRLASGLHNQRRPVSASSVSRSAGSSVTSGHLQSLPSLRSRQKLKSSISGPVGLSSPREAVL